MHLSMSTSLPLKLTTTLSSEMEYTLPIHPLYNPYVKFQISITGAATFKVSIFCAAQSCSNVVLPESRDFKYVGAPGIFSSSCSMYMYLVSKFVPYRYLTSRTSVKKMVTFRIKINVLS